MSRRMGVSVDETRFRQRKTFRLSIRPRLWRELLDTEKGIVRTRPAQTDRTNASTSVCWTGTCVLQTSIPSTELRGNHYFHTCD